MDASPLVVCDSRVAVVRFWWDSVTPRLSATVSGLYSCDTVSGLYSCDIVSVLRFRMNVAVRTNKPPTRKRPFGERCFEKTVSAIVHTNVYSRSDLSHLSDTPPSSLRILAWGVRSPCGSFEVQQLITDFLRKVNHSSLVR